MAEQTDATGVLAFYKGWDAYQEMLINAIAPLTPEQLALRSAPQLRSVEENCAHIIGARVRWCHEVLGFGDDTFAGFGEWDLKDFRSRSATELVSGIRDTWAVLQDTLQRLTTDELRRTFPNNYREPGDPETFTYQWIIWHLIEHDVHHGGEISQILGAHGLAGLNL